MSTTIAAAACADCCGTGCEACNYRGSWGIDVDNYEPNGRGENRGRPRKWNDNAHRQQAYRARSKVRTFAAELASYQDRAEKFRRNAFALAAEVSQSGDWVTLAKRAGYLADAVRSAEYWQGQADRTTHALAQAELDLREMGI